MQRFYIVPLLTALQTCSYLCIQFIVNIHIS